MATTTAAGSVTGNVSVTGGSVLNLAPTWASPARSRGEHRLGRQCTWLRDYGPRLLLGYYDTGAVTLTNAGLVNLENLSMGHGSTLTLHGGDVVNNLISLNGLGAHRAADGRDRPDLERDVVRQPDDRPQLDGPDIHVHGIGQLGLPLEGPQQPSNWISTIDSMIHDGQIVLTLLPGQSYQVADSGGYTYIYGIGGASVPEPSSLALFCMGTLGVIVAARGRRKCGDC